jgi:hypothetical protein
VERLEFSPENGERRTSDIPSVQVVTGTLDADANVPLIGPLESSRNVTFLRSIDDELGQASKLASLLFVVTRSSWW